ncbi:MAG: histidinol dehydrogenase, partial [Sphingomonadales bacterium]
MPLRLDARATGFAADFARFLNARRDDDTSVEDVVRTIIDDVRRRGDAAVLDLTEKFDKLTMTADQMRVPLSDIEAAASQCAPETLEALHLAADRIRAFHERQRPADLNYRDEAGVELGYR